ncbi:anthocyanidin reductase ((2S)-flavan-3-ol-forming)-like isoform X2 [Aristolochia californica]|uniref:anthocyanidin reductase ((2S)-flavan-3-ol-forming)-like isoform X2 n=1 Tax=Aristolochia californica TaxID=171875 RepID=UPI0035E021B6
MTTEVTREKTACVTGASGYLASLLVKQLLDKGYIVNATVRDPGNQAKISHLVSLPGSERLKLFRADLTTEGSFDDSINGCDLVFHVATPVLFDSNDPENEMIKPAIQGTLNVLRSCTKTKTVKRIVLTSSAAAVSIHREQEDDRVVTEECWTDVEFLFSEKPPAWGYAVSKTLAEKEAWKVATENQIDLISVVPVLISGPSLTPHVPNSSILALSLLTGNDAGLKAMQLASGSISLVHVEDVCRAHIFLAEKESASGRYICCAVNTSVPELAEFLSNRYPQYNVPTDFGDFSSKHYTVSAEKLIKEGFTFKFKIEEIYDESVEYFMAKGLLQK